MQNLLFICSKNQWRSPTAENIWRNHHYYNTRSAGTSSKAKRTVNNADILWADIIFVMEQKHKNRLKAEFKCALEDKKIYVLDIPDEYQYMDEDLIRELQRSVEGVIEN